jgi:carbon starvation protein CstA
MNALLLFLPVSCAFAIAYRFYGVSLSNKATKPQKVHVLPDSTALVRVTGNSYVKCDSYLPTRNRRKRP